MQIILKGSTNCTSTVRYSILQMMSGKHLNLLLTHHAQSVLLHHNAIDVKQYKVKRVNEPNDTRLELLINTFKNWEWRMFSDFIETQEWLDSFILMEPTNNKKSIIGSTKPNLFLFYFIVVEMNGTDFFKQQIWPSKSSGTIYSWVGKIFLRVY